jgi:hypothetical protein
MRQTHTSIDNNMRISIAVLGVTLLLAGAAWRRPVVRATERRPNSKLPQIQGGQKMKRVVIDTGFTHPNEPIEILDLNVEGKPAFLSKGIEAGSDWLNGLQFKVKNISNKNILTIELYLVFPDIEIRGGTQLIYPLRYGYDPKVHANSGKAEVAPMKPNDVVSFAVSESNFNSLKPLLESKILLTDIRHLRIRFELIVFDDDTAWAFGEQMRRTPGSLTWIPVQ